MAQYSAPPLSYPLVVKTFQKYFGKGPEQLFDTFTKSAVNAASMGQVHQATRNGKKLAVKIQYPGVADSVKSDLAMVKPIALSMFKLNPVEYFRADRTEAAVRGKRIEAELQYLKAQVNPHFLFNAINSVYFLIKKDPEKASETLIKLSDLLRFQLYDCSSDTIGIDQELVYLENYMALEKLRRGERVTVEYRREGELRGFQLAPLMLIPFLENAFKFVSSHTDRPNIIRVVLSREGEMFRASFFNTYEKLQRNGVGGIGLKNVTRRLELLYPKYTLDVRDEHDTYSVTLTIPLL
jgi:LytS/YehU family sensor histidine kinase